LPFRADAKDRPVTPGANMPKALRAADDSPNRVRQVGAVLVAREGTQIAACNAFPAGIRDLEERHAGDGRFVWMEHAERRAIFEAARRGVATAGAHITSTFFPASIAPARSSRRASSVSTRRRPPSTIRSGARLSSARRSSCGKAGWRFASSRPLTVPDAGAFSGSAALAEKSRRLAHILLWPEDCLGWRPG